MLKTVTLIAFNIHSTLTPPAVWLRPMRLLLVLKYCKGFLTTFRANKTIRDVTGVIQVKADFLKVIVYLYSLGEDCHDRVHCSCPC